jgi:dienelactone hydrolase
MKHFLTTAFFAMLVGTAQAGETVSYEADGGAYEGYFAKAAGTSKGLVLIIHDWDGLTDYEQKRADMLAELGYDAFAADLYGKGNRPADVAARKAETAKLNNDREKMRGLILAGLNAARERGGGDAVVMGYCFGGAAVLELARSGQAENVKGYVSFHGGLATPAGQTYPAGTAPILIAHGGADASISMQDVAALSGELEKAEVPYEIQVYSGAPHAFTEFGSDAYRERADRKSWDAFTAFLDEHLSG